MKFLTKNDAIQWCRENQINLDDQERPALDTTLKDFKIPSDAGQRVALVNTQFQEIWEEGEILIWIREWSVWESGERLHIFNRFRQSYGESRLLNEIPAQLISKNEYEDGLSIVTLAVLFLWDCYVLTKGRQVLFYSHDEYGKSSVDRLA